MKIIKKSDKTLWLTLISSCVAFYYANETSSTVNLIPARNRKMFSFSKHKDTRIRLKYSIEAGDEARLSVKCSLGAHVTGSSDGSRAAGWDAGPAGPSTPFLNSFRPLNYLPRQVCHWGGPAPNSGMAVSAQAPLSSCFCLLESKGTSPWL